MKKSGRLFVIMSLLVCVAFLGVGLIAPATVQAGKGAVKLDLHQRTGGEADNNVVGLGKYVGWAIANTIPGGSLIVKVHLDNGETDAEFTVVVKIQPTEYWQVDRLSTNRQGKGNAHYVLVGIPAASDDTIDVQVVLLEEPGWPTKYATATKPVALKK